MICNQKYILGFHPHFWHRSPKHLEFNKSGFRYIREVTFGTHLRMGGGCQGNQLCGLRLKLLVHPLTSKERKGAGS